MKKRANLSFVGKCAAGCALVIAAGCAQQPQVPETAVPPDPPAAAAAAPLAETYPAVAAPESGQPLEIREIRVVDDGGQQGIFVKLTRPPLDSTHYTLDSPSRLVIDMAGPTSGRPSAGRFAIEGNPMISGMRIGEVDGKLRLTVDLRQSRVPAYTVDSLDDALVAFIGEPGGRTGSVREQIVFRGGRPMTAVAAGEGRGAGAPQRPSSESGPPLTRLYTGQKVSLDFKDADAHNVLRLLAEVSKLNIVATDDVRGKVTLKLFEVPWDQALDIVLQALNLEMVQEGNVVRISTVSRLRAEREELQRAKEAQKAVEPMRVEYIRVNYAKAQKLANLISGVQAQQAMAGGGGGGGQRIGGDQGEEGVLSSRGTVVVDDFTNTLVIRDIQRGIDNARELVRRLDVQTPQVLIESNIVEATTDFARELGIQWGYRGAYGPETGNPTGVNFPSSVGVGGAIPGLAGVPFLVDFPAAGNFAPGRASGLDLLFGSADGATQINARITALESEGKGKVISRPRVVTLNNVPATIKSLTILRVKLPSTGTVINTGAGGAAGAQETATEKIETGIILVVTPLVSSDGFVLLDLYAKSSQADFARTVDNIPTEISREANSHILVKDGQTVVVGGIYRDTRIDNRDGVPYLKDIPALGWLFRSTSASDRREDLLVFMTPRILGAPATGMPSASELWRNRS
jgi:type IV pilus assembly protein PilQ